MIDCKAKDEAGLRLRVSLRQMESRDHTKGFPDANGNEDITAEGISVEMAICVKVAPTVWVRKISVRSKKKNRFIFPPL